MMESLFSKETLNSIINQSNKLFQSHPQNNIGDNLRKLSDSKIIQINNELNGIFNDQIKLPRIVVCGGQSSGKSSVLNSIVTMNILPTGGEMVTRSPLTMELTPLQSGQEASVEFGNYIVSDNKTNAWKPTKNIKVTYPEPSFDELMMIKNEIERITNVIAGTQKNISRQSINIKIFLPGIPNLTLIDLPGITQVACKDKGQPDDIKEQIENLIGEYIKSDETIILAVVPAREDVEADVGVGLIKKYDPNFSRSIGVLTKIDIMNQDTDVANYVRGEISKNLRMKFGYYLVRNRTNKELNSISMKDGFEKEKIFFDSHPVYSKLGHVEKKQMGIGNLREKLVQILSEKIKDCLPAISKQINDKYDKVCHELITMGTVIPNDKLGKQAYINHLIVNYYQKFTMILDGRDRDNYHIGRTIKELFANFRNTIYEINPIDDMDVSYIENISKNIEGNHMSFFIPSVSVFEACVTDVKHKPVQKLLEPSINCVSNNTKILMKMSIDILNDTRNEIYRYPNLVNYLENRINQQIILYHSDKTIQYVTDLINMEEAYIWTDSENFNNVMSELMKDKMNKIDSNTIKTLLIKYYDTIKDNIRNNIPKAIMLHLINRLKTDILTEIMNKIHIDEMVEFLEESGSVRAKREELISWRDRLSYAREKLMLV
jgi:hypothetical protein